MLTNKTLPRPRHAQLVRLFDPESDEVLDECITIYFAKPKSFTGEDVVELHVHGGKAVSAAIINTLERTDDVRLAEPGEFTRRAFENGRLDLTAAEGLADLINAETDAQRRQAVRQLRGELGEIYMDWRGRLLKAMALLEASIDFSDEDLPNGIYEEARAEIASVHREINDHISDAGRGQVLREGIHITLVGPPNAGKSTLLNRISGNDVSIVSDEEGTTRDVIEVQTELAGCPVVFADTAGLRESKNPVEAEGVKRAEERAKESDVNLVVLDGNVWPKIDKKTAAIISEDSIVVINKSDLIKSAQDQHLAISALTGEGCDKLMDILEKTAGDRTALSSRPMITRARHRNALETCAENLARSVTAQELELQAEDLRQATRSLGGITGVVGAEDVLDLILRVFCIGK